MTLHHAEIPTLAGSPPRPAGATPTASEASRFLARWVLRGEVHRVLDPSMGDGAFLDAVAAEAHERGIEPTVWGVEADADTYAATVRRGAISHALSVRDDFLRVRPFAVDAVLAHPPCVRLRHLNQHDRARALQVGAKVLGHEMTTDTGLWLPFLLHATRFVVRGGRLAFVLPFDVTHLPDARPMWRHLGRTFASLTLVRVREAMFPDLHREVILLLADQHGTSTDHVTLQAHHHLSDLGHRQPEVAARLPLAEVVEGSRPFLEALLGEDTRALLHGPVEQRTVPAHDVVRFTPGYVCGDKAFFHPTAALVRRHRLPDRSLVPTFAASRQLRGAGLWTSDAPASARSSLFLPPAEEHLLTRGEQTYLRRGERDGASRRHKCRAREPWYVTPGVKAPDVLLPVFSETPSLLVNDAGLAASKSLLCGHLRGITGEHLATAWYTSLTLLQLELRVQSLVRGVPVLVPDEAGGVRLPRAVHATPGHLDRVSTLLAARRPLDAFRLGDGPVLGGQLGLSDEQVMLIRSAATELAAWRTAYRAGPSPSAGSASAAS